MATRAMQAHVKALCVTSATISLPTSSHMMEPKVKVTEIASALDGKARS